jgi:hypothetical protein
MLDDRRRVEIGRITLIAGLIFSLLHLIATWAMVYPAFVMARNLIGGAGRTRITQPADPNQSVPPLQLPGMSQFPGPSGPTSVPDADAGSLPAPNFPRP